MANTGTVKNIGTLLGGTGADTITLGAAVANVSIDLGAGSDVLTFGNFTNTATVANTETITGGTGNDTVTLSSALTTGMSVDLGAGSNKLTLANVTNTGTVSNVQTLIGGSGADTITLGNAMVNGSVDLGAGNDMLQFANATNHRIRDEYRNGLRRHRRRHDRVDRLERQPGRRGRRFELHHRQYRCRPVRLRPGQLPATPAQSMNFNSAKGDMIALDTTGSSTLTGNTYDLGGAALGRADLTSAADATTRLAVSLSNGGNGGFVYQQDTGELYYSANGSFAGGGTLVGVIDSSGTTPWTFDATKFTQV